MESQWLEENRERFEAKWTATNIEDKKCNHVFHRTPEGIECSICKLGLMGTPKEIEELLQLLTTTSYKYNA